MDNPTVQYKQFKAFLEKPDFLEHPQEFNALLDNLEQAVIEKNKEKTMDSGV